jgi:type II secretory pathway pseudopilin PulG
MLMDLVMVVIIVGILLAAAVSSFFYTRDRAEEVVAAINVREVAPAIEAWREDNDGSAADIDDDASTSGYEGMTLPLLQANYAQALTGVDVPAPGFVLTPADFCVSSSVGPQTFFKHGPDGPITEVSPLTPLCS